MTKDELVVLLSARIPGETVWLPEDTATALIQEAVSEAQRAHIDVRFVVGLCARTGSVRGKSRFVAVVSPDIVTQIGGSDQTTNCKVEGSGRRITMTTGARSLSRPKQRRVVEGDDSPTADMMKKPFLNDGVQLSVAMMAASMMGISMPASAQEFSLFGGGSRAGSTNTYTWAFNYQEGHGPYFAASFTWLNEGHIPDHHRDGQLVQLWARIPVASPQVILQAGVGPYRYFDTTTAELGGSYSDVHGWGVVYSVRAAYYASSRWITQLQVNRVHVQRGPDATSVMLGIGYQLDAPDTPGPRAWASGSASSVTNNVVAVYLGKTIVNSTSSPAALGGAIEYRRGLMKYMDITVGYLHEGSSKNARRDEITGQL